MPPTPLRIMIKITNLKVRFRVKNFSWPEYRSLQHDLKDRQVSFKCFGNFFVLKTEKSGRAKALPAKRARSKKSGQITTTCFYNGWINVTGISNLENISVDCMSVASLLFPNRKRSFSCLIERFTLDNISATGYDEMLTDSFHSIVDNREMILKRLEGSVLNISHNNHRFPGIFIKTTSGTCIVYRTGKYVAVGVRKIGNLSKIQTVIHHVSVCSRCDRV